MKYLKSKLSLYISLILVLTVIFLTAISSVLYYRSAMAQSEQNSSYLAAAYKQGIDSLLNSYRKQLGNVASKSFLTDESLSQQDQKLRLAEEVEGTGFKYIAVADAKGNSSAGGSIAEKDFFQQAQNGETYFSSPTVNSDGELTLFLATSIGGTDEILYGELPYEAISAELNQIKVGESGYAFAVNRDGYTVIHPNADNIINPVNYFELAEKDTSYEPTATIFRHMTAGETGIGYSYYNGVRRLVGYTTLDGPEGWSLAVTTPVTQVVEDLRNTLLFCVGTGALLLLAAILVTSVFSKKITEPINKVTRRIELLAQGDLHEEMEPVKGRDESARLALALQDTVHNLRSYITDILDVLNAIADKDLTVQSSVKYSGDFIPIQESLQQIVESLNITLKGITLATNQVRTGSEQVALGGQNLAENSSEQASTTDRLTESLGSVASHIQENAEYSVSMQDMTRTALDDIQQGGQEMQKMQESMENISSFSKEIQNIVHVIDDIAFQTNILALNAAVEAARAGEAGKGFSVVADEVRQLASRSAEAAKDTTSLIENTIQSVDLGMKNVEQTAGAFRRIVDQTNHINELVGRITESLERQSQSVAELNDGMKQIAVTTQANSSTAEESAATSEELLSQMQALDEMVSEFRTN